MKTILAYGSLRFNEYNFNSFSKHYGKNNIKYQGTIELEGYELYSLGSYPGIKESNKNNKLVVDILEVSEKVFKNINDMELGANYEAKELAINNRKATIYIYKGKVFEEKLVKSGDWSKYLKSK